MSHHAYPTQQQRHCEKQPQVFPFGSKKTKYPIKDENAAKENQGKEKCIKQRWFCFDLIAPQQKKTSQKPDDSGSGDDPFS
jgi:hypothetical protein